MPRTIPLTALVSLPISLILAGSILGQQQKLPPEGPEHFRWSEEKARELDTRHTIKSAADLNAYQKTKLTDAVVRQLKAHPSLNEFFAGMPENKLHDLAADTRVELIDLNGDGTPEVIAQANGLGLCGGTGNCIFWIFQMRPTGIILLLDTLQSEAGFQVITIRPWSTDGFRDIVLGSYGSDTTRNIVWYRYSMGRYRSWKCYSLDRGADKGASLLDPVISEQSCAGMFGAPK
jgi:hypothetical protein